MKVNFHLDKKSKPQSESGIKVVYGQAKRGGYRVRWYLILAIVISPLLAMGYYLFRTQVLVTAPAILTTNPVTINATHPSVVGPLPSTIGKAVLKKDTLVLLENHTLEQEIKFIQQELLKLPQVSDNQVERLYVQAIRESKDSLDKVNEIREKYAKYRAKGQVSDVDYASIISSYNSLNSQLNSQKIAYAEAKRKQAETMLAGPMALEYRALMKEMVVLRSTQNDLTIKAPFTGRVIDVHIREGEQVDVGDPLITVSKNITPTITAFLDPKYLKHSHLGTEAKVKFPDGKTYQAIVSSPVEVVNKLPAELQSPFEGQPAYLKVNLSFDEALEERRWIEGVEVEVIF